MNINQEPSTNTFFLRIEEGKLDEVAQLLAPLGVLEDLPVDRGMLLRMRGNSSDPRGTWHKIQNLLGERATAQPVLLDESGHEQYPTGDISVRFLNAVSDLQLMQFAESYALRLRKRNEFVPEQAVFTPFDAGRHFLPDLVLEIGSDSEVKAVWANTMARYQRL